MESGVGFALLRRRRTQLLGRCEEFVKTMAHFVANRCHTPERSQRSDTARSCRHSIGAASLPLGPGLVPRAAGRGEALRRSRSGGLTWRSEILAWRGSRRKSGRAPCRKLVVDLSARWDRTPSTLRPGETTQPHVVARPGPSRKCYGIRVTVFRRRKSVISGRRGRFPGRIYFLDSSGRRNRSGSERQFRLCATAWHTSSGSSDGSARRWMNYSMREEPDGASAE